jgi:hypothetical protein
MLASIVNFAMGVALPPPLVVNYNVPKTPKITFAGVIKLETISVCASKHPYTYGFYSFLISQTCRCQIS